MNARRSSSAPVIHGIVATAIAVALVAAGVSPANAKDAAEDAAESTAALIDRVAPDQGAVVEGRTAASGTEFATATSTITAPETADDGVAITGGDGAEVSIQLPPEAQAGRAEVASDGTVVYAGDAGGSAAVQVLDDGAVRIQTVIAAAGDAHEFSYSVEGGLTPMTDGEGNFAFASDAGLLSVAAPWAKDAAGADVPTHYELRGDDLVQVVEPAADAAYPIVADPVWVWMWGGFGMKLNRAETKQLSTWAGVTGMCATLVKRYAGLAPWCAGAAAYIFAQAQIANGANPKECLFITAVPAPLVFRYRDGHCK